VTLHYNENGLRLVLKQSNSIGLYPDLNHSVAFSPLPVYSDISQPNQP
jgi:hypothetical protein